jgi:hypothetical protein
MYVCVYVCVCVCVCVCVRVYGGPYYALDVLQRVILFERLGDRACASRADAVPQEAASIHDRCMVQRERERERERERQRERERERHKKKKKKKKKKRVCARLCVRRKRGCRGSLDSLKRAVGPEKGRKQGRALIAKSAVL